MLLYQYVLQIVEFFFNLGKEHSVSVGAVTKMVAIKIKALSKKSHHLIFLTEQQPDSFRCR